MNLLEFYCINLDTSMATQFDGCMGSPPSTRRETNGGDRKRPPRQSVRNVDLHGALRGVQGGTSSGILCAFATHNPESFCHFGFMPN
jgi:hypothetical protein